jgi:hypothetical protein
LSGYEPTLPGKTFQLEIGCPDFGSIVFRRQFNTGSMIMDMRHPPNTNKVLDNILSEPYRPFCLPPPNRQVEIVENVIEEARQTKFRFLEWENHQEGWYVELCDGSGTTKPT